MPKHTHFIVATYPRYFGSLSILSMPFFHIYFKIFKRISFYKLMGCGKNKSFSIIPDWRNWVVLWNDEDEHAIKFIYKWYTWFNCKTMYLKLNPIEGHGTWEGKQVFGQLTRKTDVDGKIAVLTRATIRLSKLSSFWKHVPTAEAQLHHQHGLLYSVGVGEVPLIKQGTLSVWQNKDCLKQYAYAGKHAEVIAKSRKEKWYAEEMFVRFSVLQQVENIHLLKL